MSPVPGDVAADLLRELAEGLILAFVGEHARAVGLGHHVAAAVVVVERGTGASDRV